jgi:hypothetical protein
MCRRSRSARHGTGIRVARASGSGGTSCFSVRSSSSIAPLVGGPALCISPPPPTAAAAASRTTGSYLPWRSHILASRCTVCARCVWGGAGHAEQQGALRYFMSAQPDAPEMDCLCAGRPYLAEACVKAALFLFLFFEPSSTRMPALQHRNRWMVLGWVAGFRSACMTPCCTHA